MEKTIIGMTTPDNTLVQPENPSPSGAGPMDFGGGGQTLRNSKEVGEKDTFPQDEGKHDAVLKGQRER